MVDLNVLGLLYCAHAALPHLLQRRRDEPAPASPTWSTSARWRAAWPATAAASTTLTKHGVGAFSESLRQEVTEAARARLAGRAGRGRDRAGRPQPARGPRAASAQRFGDVERLEADGHRRRDRLHRHPPRHVAINEILIRPTEQEG